VRSSSFTMRVSRVRPVKCPRLSRHGEECGSVHRWSRANEGRSSRFSIGGMVAQQITLDRPDLIRKLILVGTAPRNHDAEMGKATSPRRPPAIFGATYNPPENLWLKVFFTDTERAAAGRAFLKRYLSRTENRDTSITTRLRQPRLPPSANGALHPGERFAYLKNIKQPVLVSERKSRRNRFTQ